MWWWNDKQCGCDSYIKIKKNVISSKRNSHFIIRPELCYLHNLHDIKDNNAGNNLICDRCIKKYLVSGDLYQFDDYKYGRYPSQFDLYITVMLQLHTYIANEFKDIKRGQPYDAAISTMSLTIFSGYLSVEDFTQKRNLKGSFDITFKYGNHIYEIKDCGHMLKTTPEKLTLKLIATIDYNNNNSNNNDDENLDAIVNLFDFYPFYKIYKDLKKRLIKELKQSNIITRKMASKTDTNKDDNNEKDKSCASCGTVKCFICDYYFEETWNGAFENQGNDCAGFISNDFKRIWCEFGSKFDNNCYSICDSLQHYISGYKAHSNDNQLLICDYCILKYNYTGQLSCKRDITGPDDPFYLSVVSKVKKLIMAHVGKEFITTIAPRIIVQNGIDTKVDVTGTAFVELLNSILIERFDSNSSKYITLGIRFKYLNGLFVFSYVTNPKQLCEIVLVGEMNNPDFHSVSQDYNYGEKYPNFVEIYHFLELCGPEIIKLHQNVLDNLIDNLK